MNVTRIMYGAEETSAEVDWPAHYLTKRGQRTNRDAHGGGGHADERGGGHSYVKQQRRVQEQRNLFANEAAQRLGEVIQPEDLLVLEGVEEARQQMLSRLPQELADGAVQLSAPDPTEDDRDRFARLRLLAERSRFQEAAKHAREFASSPSALSGVEAVHNAANEGRVASVIVHQDATNHMGYAHDIRLRESSVDEDAVEAALSAALAQGAAVYFTDEDRVIEEQGGIIAVPRY
jgi:hypothetical protein